MSLVNLTSLVSPARRGVPGGAPPHVGRILVKLGLRDRTQAAVFAYESGLVRPSGY
ncbi:hypothetical protein SHIRM173S_07684 [Streptomyces hirsutus]